MSDPARDLRYARWLLERAIPELGSTPNIQTGADCARALLAAIVSYEPDDEQLFAQLQTVIDNHLDFWADLKAAGQSRADPGVRPDAPEGK